MAHVLAEFEDFPRERELVGKLLIAYGEIEFALLGCLREVLDEDVHTATRILFRVRGESARIEVADAIIRPSFQKMGLGGEWGNAIGAARVCKNIRNQYAHCHWQIHDDGVLRFVNLDEEAVAQEGPLEVEMIPLILRLLEEQDRYFEYALDSLYWLAEECRKRHGRPALEVVKPKSIAAPLLYNRPKTASPNSPDKASGS